MPQNAVNVETAETGKREQNAARNRAAILQAARQAFCELGFGAATVRDVIRRTDLASGTFYNYFPDKESLLRELVGDFQAELLHKIHEAREAAETLEQLLRSAFRVCFEIFMDDQDFLQLMARNSGEIEELTAAKALEPAISDLARDLRAKALEGVVPASINFDLIAQSAVAVGSELAFHAVRTQADVEAATDFATDLFMGGIERMGRRP